MAESVSWAWAVIAACERRCAGADEWRRLDVGERELVVATGNPHKVEEMSAILGPALAEAGVRLVGLKELESRGLGPFREPEEVGETFELNAAIKALSYAEQTGMACVADDSGLEVDALGGRPGVISSHYFNEGRTDGAAAGIGRAERDRLNLERVMREMGGVEFERRGARFVCVMAVAGWGLEARNPIGGGRETLRPVLMASFRGAFEGRIGFAAGECPVGRGEWVVPRGGHGFGYDPIFLVGPGYGRTSAELEPGEKNRVSHRARAAEMLSSWIGGGGLADGE